MIRFLVISRYCLICIIGMHSQGFGFVHFETTQEGYESALAAASISSGGQAYCHKVHPLWYIFWCIFLFPHLTLSWALTTPSIIPSLIQTLPYIHPILFIILSTFISYAHHYVLLLFITFTHSFLVTFLPHSTLFFITSFPYDIFFLMTSFSSLKGCVIENGTIQKFRSNRKAFTA